MSNLSIVHRLLEICDKFEQNNMSLEEFQSKIYAHGSALEGLGNEWYDLLSNLESECEVILFTESPIKHHVLGLKVLEKLREYLKQNFDNL